MQRSILVSQKPGSPLLQIVFVIDGERVHGCAKRDLLMVRHYGRIFIWSPGESTCAPSIRGVRDEETSADESRRRNVWNPRKQYVILMTRLFCVREKKHDTSRRRKCEKCARIILSSSGIHVASQLPTHLQILQTSPPRVHTHTQRAAAPTHTQVTAWHGCAMRLHQPPAVTSDPISQPGHRCEGLNLESAITANGT